MNQELLHTQLSAIIWFEAGYACVIDSSVIETLFGLDLLHALRTYPGWVQADLDSNFVLGKYFRHP
jgi:plasmid replication initiation protein